MGDTTMSNQHGYSCPECGGQHDIIIQARIWVLLTDDGTDVDAPDDGSHEWDGNSLVGCEECGFEGTVDQLKSEVTE